MTLTDRANTTDTPRNLSVQIVAATIARAVTNTARRFMYPFAPAISRGLGVPIAAISTAIAIQQFSGVLSPLFGPVIDRISYRRAMLLGLGLVGMSLISVGFFPIYLVLAVALLGAGLGRNIFDPALQAYVGQQVPFAYRGRIMGLIELSWSASSLIGIPLIGLLMARRGWQSPFFVLGGLCLGMMLILAVLLPRPTTRTQPEHGVVRTILLGWRNTFTTPRTAGVLLYVVALNGVNDLFFVVYGVWMEEYFAVTLVALGATTVVVGMAELFGEGMIVWFADRIGLKRAIIGGTILTAIAYVLLPFLAFRLDAALVALFILFAIFEFTIIATITLVTELMPDSRATMMSGYKAAAGSGRMVGALMGVPLYLLGGIMAIGLTAGIVTLAGLIALILALRHWQVEGTNSP